MLTFIQGLFMGLAYVAPIGMQNLFVINGAVTYKKNQAVFVGLAVAFFDVTLALACFFGIGALLDRYLWLHTIVLIVGALLILWIAITLFRSKPEETTAAGEPFVIKKVLFSAFAVTWFNPQAILDGTMMLGAFRASLPSETAILFLFGVLCASLVWFNGLSFFTRIIGHKLNYRILRIINIVCGVILIFYAARLLLTFFF